MIRTNGDKSPANSADAGKHTPVDDFLKTSFQSDDEFWSSNDFLQQLYDASVDHMLQPWGVLMTVLAYATLKIPPQTYLQTIHGTSPLNLYVAACGNSGSGKSQSMYAASQIIQDIPSSCLVLPGVTSGEGLLSCFATAEYDKDENGRPDKSNGVHMQVHHTGILAEVDEISRFAAQSGRDGSTAIATMLTGWSGGTLGDMNKSPERRTLVPGNAYRLSAIFGVQPSAAKILIDGSGVGFTQRFLWCEMCPDKKSDKPFEQRTHWPACTINMNRSDIGISCSDILYWENLYRNNDRSGINTDLIYMPEKIAMACEDLLFEIRRKNSECDVNDAHVTLLLQRVAAVLSIIETGGLPGFNTVTEDAWERAKYIVAYSRSVRESVFRQYIEQCSSAEARRLYINGKADDEADARLTNERTERCKKSIVGFLCRHNYSTDDDLDLDNMERTGELRTILGSDIQRGLTSRIRKQFKAAMEDLQSENIIVSVKTNPDDPYEKSRWCVIWSNIPDKYMPKDMIQPKQ